MLNLLNYFETAYYKKKVINFEFIIFCHIHRDEVFKQFDITSNFSILSIIN